MKKLIAVLLAFAMVLPMVFIPVGATQTDENTSFDSAFVEGENSIILFVTGIGQSFSYLFDKSYLEEGAFENGTLQDYENYAPLIAEGKHSARWNLFNNFGEAFADKDTIKKAVSVVLKLLFSGFLRKNIIKTEEVEELLAKLFHFNLLDENGKGDPRVITPRHVCPVSEYPGVIDENGQFKSEFKTRFYTSVPCQDIAKARLGDNFEDYLYVYNYNAFSYTSDNVQGLHDFIETILETNKVGAKDVVLVPMSMGASVVSAYMYAYPNVEDNHIKRVVSVVGCWNGSDVVADLLTQSYCDNSAELFYNGIIGDLIGEPWGDVFNIAIRIFPKNVLRSFIDQVLGVLSKDLFLSTPSLCNLIPSYRYDEISKLIENEAVKVQAAEYHQAQVNLLNTIETLEAQGVTFSFIAGYGLPYGAYTTDYKAFGFMEHSPTTNSDEIINIESTVPGTTAITPGTTFSDTEGRIISPDGSLDISTSIRKDASWFFYKQKHELEYNNTSLALAIDLALGQIKNVEDCDNFEEDGYYYPQFNDGRNLKSVIKNYIPDLNRYCAENNYTLTPEQQDVYNRIQAMMASTKNDLEADNQLIEEFHAMLVEIGVYAPAKQPSKFESFFASSLENANDITYKLFGAKGFLDFCIKK